MWDGTITKWMTAAAAARDAMAMSTGGGEVTRSKVCDCGATVVAMIHSPDASADHPPAVHGQA